MRATLRALPDADSTEFDPQTPHRVIYKLRELLGVDEMGGTMRLGAWPCKIEKDSTAFRAYGTTDISERHRHRYEFNCEYEKTLTDGGIPHHRALAGRQVRGDRRGSGPSLVSGLPVSSGIQVQAARAASAVLRVHGRGARASETSAAAMSSAELRPRFPCRRNHRPATRSDFAVGFEWRRLQPVDFRESLQGLITPQAEVLRYVSQAKHAPRCKTLRCPA